VKACIALFAISVLGGCFNRSIVSQLKPSSPADDHLPPLLSQAIRVEPTETRFLSDHDAAFVGVLELTQGDELIAVASFEDFRQEAPRAAARVGGTHFALAASGFTRLRGPPFAAYNVWRVSPDRWSQLPMSLRPRP
jgi:hypothetical protein